jgi:hypothetical protein
MMMMTTRRVYFILFCVLLPLSVFGQDKDFGIWYGISAEYKLSKKVELDLSTDVRTFENASKVEEAFLETGATYNFNKYFAASGSYRLVKNLEDDNSYYYQHKFFIDLKGKVPLKNFTFLGSFRFQTRSKTYIEDIDDEDLDYTGKLKLKTVYRTPTFPVNPYVYSEVFLPLFSEKTSSSETVGKVRYSAGLELKITKKQSVEIEYIYQRDYLPHLRDINIISVNYNIKF